VLTPIGSTRLQRFLRGAVACLLTANGFAVAVLASDEVAGPLPTEQGTRTVTLIQAPDGTTTEVDPSTPAGQAAIEQAKRAGATITETTVPAEQAAQQPQEGTTPSTLAQETTPTSGLLPTLPTLPVDPQKTIDDGQGLLDDTIDKVQETVPTPLDETVDKVQETVGGTVDKVQETVTTVLPPVIPTTPTTKPPTTTTTKPPTQVVDDTVGTVTGTVGGVTGKLGL